MTLFIILAVILAAGAGAYYWFFMKKKAGGEGVGDMASTPEPSTPEAPQGTGENFGGGDATPTVETPSMNEPANTGGEGQEGVGSGAEEKKW